MVERAGNESASIIPALLDLQAPAARKRAFIRSMLRHALLAAAFWVAFIGPATAADNSARPNILWLIIEDVGCDFGCYGEPGARTPNLDRFARESRMYRNAFTTAPVCSPARAAM